VRGEVIGKRGKEIGNREKGRGKVEWAHLRCAAGESRI